MTVDTTHCTDIVLSRKYKIFRDVKTFVGLILMQIVVLLVLPINFLVKFFRFLFPKKPKCVKGKVALITGGANGIGRAIAKRLAFKGCNIVIVDVNYDAALKTANELIGSYKIKAIACKCDVSKHEEVMEVKKAVENSLGCVDLLINNAGNLAMDVSLMEKGPENIRSVIDVNLVSHFWTIRAFLDSMIERKSGHIIAICSLAGKLPMPHATVYCASKFGVTGMMSALYDELCGLGHDGYIKTTTVYPSWVATSPQILEIIGKHPYWSADEAADATVKGILNEERVIFIPGYIKLLTLMNFYPDAIMRFMKLRTDSDKILEIRKSNIV